jgi:hypothetical protein
MFAGLSFRCGAAFLAELLGLCFFLIDLLQEIEEVPPDRMGLRGVMVSSR